MQGRIIKALAGFYYVEHDGVVYQTRARGNFRKKGQTPYVGDFVEFSAEENSEGYILDTAMAETNAKSNGKTCQLKKKERDRCADSNSLNHGSKSLISSKEKKNDNSTVSVAS